MSISLGCCFNVYNDADALSGMLENAASFFDDLFCVHSGPEGKKSDDGTIELLEKWGVRTVYEDISQGFGAIRTKALHGLTTEFGFILDADERYHPIVETLECHGTEGFPAQQEPNLTVTVKGQAYNQGRMLRDLLTTTDKDCLVGVRRHWMDFSMRRPAQNWYTIRDFQCRCLRNAPHIGFKPEEKMHEKVVDFRTGGEPSMLRIESPSRGIFWDHYSIPFKRRNPKKNVEDLATYRALHEPSTRDMWLNHQPMA